MPWNTGNNVIQVRRCWLLNFVQICQRIFVVPGQLCEDGIQTRWRALWLTLLSWTVSHVNYPSQGEIDILENINEKTTSLQTLHTNDGCQVVGNQLGKQQSDNEITWNCYDQAYSSNYGSQYPYQGCSANNTDPKSYGSTFNGNGGGVCKSPWDCSWPILKSTRCDGVD